MTNPTTSDPLQFARLVADMRSAQKEYFRTRSASALTRSKSLESRVDEMLRILLSQNRQASLFPKEQ